MLFMFILGFASGLPLSLVLSSLQAYLKDFDISLRTIGLFSIITSVYTFKFLWAPLIDSIRLPYITKLLGRRRSWLLVIQIMLGCALFMVGQTNPSTHLLQLFIFVTATAFLSASQDIVIDAFRIEFMEEREQGRGAAMLVFAYRIAMLVSSAGALFLSDIYSWKISYAVMGLCYVPIAFFTLMMPEPKVPFKFADKFGVWFKNSCVEPFNDFFKRSGAIAILFFIFFYKMSDAFIAPMLMPFYNELDFTNTEIATIVKIYGFAATILGTFIGGILTDKVSLNKMLFYGVLLQILTNLVFIMMYHQGHDANFLIFTIALENFANGLSAVVLVAYISLLCNKHFSATQYALLSAVAAGTRSFLSASSGILVEQVGWEQFFAISCLLSCPSFLFLYLLKHNHNKLHHDKIQKQHSV